MRLLLLAHLLRCIATVKAPKDPGVRDFIISEHGGFQHNNQRLLRVDLSKLPAKRNNDLWERFGFGSWLEDVVSDSLKRPVHTSYLEEEWPAAAFDAKDLLPVSESQQNIASISEAQWPVNFCINATILAPDASATPVPDQKYMVIALLGGGPSVANGTDSCGNFIIFVMYGNAVGMGVSASGKDWAGNDCTTNFMSDAPVATTQNLTSGSVNDLTFCYDSAQMRAEIYINGNLDVSAQKEFIFPREGAVTFLAGSHEKQQEVLETTLSKFSITPYPRPTTTTTTGSVTTTSVTRDPDAPILFTLPNTPRIAIDQRTAEINEAMWPEDFCVSINITTPSVQTDIRTIGLFGGDARCDSFAVFFADANTVGMGSSCETDGPAAPLVTNASIGSGSHFISFCYAQQEGKASIIVDGQVMENDDRTWSYQRSGFVTVFGGSHTVGDKYRELQEATLWSMEMVECTPGQMPPLTSRTARSGGGERDTNGAGGGGGVDGNPDSQSFTTTVTTTMLNITQVIEDALGATTTTTLVNGDSGNSDGNSTGNTDGNSDGNTDGSTGGSAGTATTTTTVTTTTITITTQRMKEHVVSMDNSSDVVTNHTEHHHSEDSSVSDKTHTQGWTRHVEGDERPATLNEEYTVDETDDDPAIYNRFVPVDA
jgi:hypothetical protein